MGIEDRELVSRMADHDREAFAQFFDRYAPRMLGLLISMLGRRSEAEDALQETFLQVWKGADRYRPERSSPAAWLTMIARSRALDHLRRLKGSAAPLVLEELIGADGGDAVRGESVRLARSALASLPEEQRSAIALAFFHGYTHERVAEHQAIPLGTAKSRIRLGILRLRDILNGTQTGSVA